VKKQPTIHPLFVLLFGILAVSTAAIFIRFAQEYATSLVIAFYRLGIATLILAPFALTRYWGEIKSMKRRDLFLASLSGLFLALHFATWITSLEYTTVASSVVLVSTVPLWVALLSPLFLKEKLSKFLILGMFFALIGGIVVGLSDTCVISGIKITCPSVDQMFSTDRFIGNILALVGAIMAACYLIIGRGLRTRIQLTSYIFLVYGMAALILLLILIIVSEPLIGYPPIGYLWFFLLALIPQVLGHSSFNWALGYLSAAFVSISLLGEPIGSTILAYFLLNETPSFWKLIGAILILVGIYIASLGEFRSINLKDEA